MSKKQISAIIIILLLSAGAGFGGKFYLDSKSKSPNLAINSNSGTTSTGKLDEETSTGDIDNETLSGELDENIGTGTTSDDNGTGSIEKGEFALIHGLPISPITQNTLIALYNYNTNEISLIPNSYYAQIENEKGEKEDSVLNRLNGEELEKFFTEIGFNIKENVEIDREKVFGIFTEKMNVDGETYNISFNDEKGKEKLVPIKNGINLFNLAAKETNLWNLENMQIQLLELMKDEDYLKEIFNGKFNSDIYTGEYLSLTGKKEIFENKKFGNLTTTFDKDNNYLKSLISGDYSVFEDMKDSEKENQDTSTGSISETGTGTEVKTDKPLTAKERMLKLREERAKAKENK